MTMQPKRSTDAEAVAALIWLAFVAQEGSIPLEDDGRAYCSFTRALELYADTRQRETEAREAALREVEAERQRLLAEMQAEPVPESDTAPTAKPPDTHTHTHSGDSPAKSSGEAEGPANFAGKGSGEKRRIYERLTLALTGGAGTARRLSALTDGRISEEDIHDMAGCRKRTLEQWRILEAALDRMDEN